MKKIVFLLIPYLFVSLALNAQSKGKWTDATFKVYGNCGMCKSTIEKSLAEIDGVKNGKWDQESKMMTVKYDATVIELEKIKRLVADAGYDSDSQRATEEKYKSLHKCCQYDRPE